MAVDDVFEPGIRPVVATTEFEGSGKLTLLHEPVDMLAAVGNALPSQVAIAENSHLHAPPNGEQLVARAHIKTQYGMFQIFRFAGPK